MHRFAFPQNTKTCAIDILSFTDTKDTPIPTVHIITTTLDAKI
jgi:hypothetical protein